MVKYEGRQGKEKDLEQFSEAINIIRLNLIAECQLQLI